MGRPKAFDPETVLDQVTATFWSRGYANTSVADLEAATGLGRQSLYDTFGDKHALYLEALRHYTRENQASTACLLENAGEGLTALRKYLVGVVDALSGQGNTSCFLVNSALECADQLPEVRATCNANAASLISTISTVLSVAVTRGEMRRDADVPALARMLTAQLFGLSVLLKGGASRDDLLASVDAAIGQLRQSS